MTHAVTDKAVARVITNGLPESEQEANTDLIAAAPELLQAAKDVLEYMCADDDAFTTHEKAMRDSKLQGAIAKADGHRE